MLLVKLGILDPVRIASLSTVTYDSPQMKTTYFGRDNRSDHSIDNGERLKYEIESDLP